MSDGGGGSDSRGEGAVNGRTSRSNDDDGGSVARRAASDEYGREVSKIAAAQICESVGFESFQSSALESLSNIVVKYLRDLGKTAAFYANLAGRTESNVFDVVKGLEDFSQGFSGQLDLDHSVVRSGALKDLAEYVELVTEETPFAQPLPRFPVIRDRKKTVPSFAQMGETPTGKHIPEWLPAFPDSHTYKHTPMWNERATDPRAEKIEQARQRRKAERSLLSLQQRLLCNSSSTTPSSTNTNLVDDVKIIEKNGNNPYIVSPLQGDGNDILPVSIPKKISNSVALDTHFSVLDAFAPAIEVMKDGICEVSDKEVNVLPDKRPAVQLKFGFRKKLLGESLKLGLPNRGIGGRDVSWMEQGDERDDKKRRAAFILRQSMKNPQELTQL